MGYFEGRRADGVWLTAVCAALAPGYGSLAHAAEAPAAADSTVQEVVVTAERRSENIQRVPSSVQAVSAQDIQTMGLAQTSDLGRITPNVSITLPTGEGNQPTITIRGIGLNDYDTNNAGPNGVYVDDVYISNPSAQSFGIFDLRQIQVLKGPQGTLYGRNTSGGAVVFTSNSPTDALTADAHIEYGSFNSYQLEGAVGGPVTANLDARVALVINHSDGFMHDDTTDSATSGIDNQSVRLLLLYKPTDNLSVLFNTMVGHVHNLPEEYRHVGTFEPGTNLSANPVVCSPAQANAGGCVDIWGFGTPTNFYDGSFNRREYLTALNVVSSLKIDYDLNDFKFTSISAYQHYNKLMPEDSAAAPYDLLRATYGVNSNTFTQEFRVGQTEKAFDWVAGVYYLDEELDQNQPLSLFYDGDLYGGFGIAPGPGAFDGIAQISNDSSKQHTESAAVYGQGDYNWGKFTLTLGGRYTYERKTFDYLGSTRYQLGGLGHYGPLIDIIADDESQTASNATWRVAGAYHVTSSIMGYASAATGFKSGDFNGGYLSNIAAQALLQLKPVAPEKVTAYEVGAKSSFFDHHLQLDGAIFYNQYDNQQIFAVVPQEIQTSSGLLDESTNILANAKSSHTEGVELQLTAIPIDRLTINLQPAWLRTRIDDAGLPVFSGSIPLNGNQLANAPKFSFFGTVDYRIPLPNSASLILEWDSSYRSHQFFDTTNDPYIQQNGYWIHDANVTYKSKWGWELGLYARNLTGTQYLLTNFDLTEPFGSTQGTVGMPRTVGAEFTYHY